MRAPIVTRTVVVVLFGLLLGGLLLRARDRVWSQGGGDYAKALVDAGVAPSVPSVKVVLFDSEDGGRVENARVYFGGEAAKAVRSDDAGVAQVLLPGGPSATLRVEAEGYASTSRRLELEPSIGTVAFRLQQGVSLSGELHNPDGSPAANEQVSASRLDWMELKVGSTRTDAEGHFQLNALQERSVLVTAGNGALRAEAYVQLPRDDLTLVLSDKSVVLARMDSPKEKGEPPLKAVVLPNRTIRVVDPSGKPVPGARVYALRDGDRAMRSMRMGDAALLGYSDPNGELRASTDVSGCLVAGAYPFVPSPADPCVASNGSGDVELKLQSAGWIDGEVTAENGADMWLVGEEPDGVRVATDGSGRFKLGPLGAGEHTITVLSPDGKTRLNERANVVAGVAKVRLEAK